jgi:hypothetical protein
MISSFSYNSIGIHVITTTLEDNKDPFKEWKCDMKVTAIA